MRHGMRHSFPFDRAQELSEDEFDSLEIGEDGMSALRDYSDSIFSYYDITERERPDDPDDDDPEDWPVKSRVYFVTRHHRSEVPPFDVPIKMPSSRMSGLLIKADGYSDRSDLQDSFFECKFVELTEEGFIYEVTRRRT
ncbi:MAG: hypothetical protein KDK78_05820 [Chlamydiia bacterium]|nr:hypothetical protein [Chlamydiia bacterium]